MHRVICRGTADVDDSRQTEEKGKFAVKKRIILLCAAAVLVAAVIVGGSIASISATGKVATNEMTARTLKVNVSSNYTLDTENLMPGDTVDKNATTFTVKNTAATPAYIRVTVNKFLLSNANENGSDWQKNTALSASLISLNVDGNQNWLRAQGGMLSTSHETDVLYYSIPVGSGESVSLPLSLMIDTKADDSYINTRIELNVKVDAVQYAQGENKLNADGILGTFGVAATLNSDGSISMLSE